ncbi:hypothetical protein MVEN_01877800 [Mycena venus]|uniref:Uncharacterized protein n=1 Tax=Mycena venus TaxID=2733690 RepID=A0A8H7CKT6_9AGAR|nr:hypothetical protein MVEN_01877800 [Mycena venus]
MNNLGMLPLLLPESEHKMSEVAICRPLSIPRLLRVAWRIKNWVKPLLFFALLFKGATSIDEFPQYSLGTFSRTKPEFFLLAVRNVIGLLLPDDIYTVICFCPCIQNLYVSGTWKLHSVAHPVSHGI